MANPQVKCLFCCAQVETNFPIPDRKRVKLLSIIHRKLCSSLELVFPSKFRRWDFSKELFPFCKSCEIDSVKLCRLTDESRVSEAEVTQVVNKLIALILVSSDKVGNHHQNSASGCGKRAEKQLREKHQFFRNFIIQRFRPEVMIERIDINDPKVAGSRSGLFLEASRSQSPRIKIVSEKNRAVFYDDEHDPTFDPAYSPDSESPSPTDDECAVVSAEEDSDEESNSGMGSENPADDDLIIGTVPASVSKNQKISSAAEGSNGDQDAGTNNGPIPIPPKSTLLGPGPLPDIKPWELERNYLYCGVGVKLLGRTSMCMTCGEILQESAKPYHKNSYLKMKRHIREKHVPKPGKSNRIDEATGTYSFEGFQYREVEGGHECSVCKRVFKVNTRRTDNKINIRNHIKTSHMRIFVGTCELCGLQSKNLRQHMHVSHPDKKKSIPMICGTCGVECKSSLLLKQHQRKHKVSQGLGHKCSQCPKVFAVKSYLKLHVKIHAETKEFVCEVCGRQFSLENVYKTHVANIHGERKFGCDQCELAFGVKFLLNRHVRYVHLGIKGPQQKKKKKGAGEEPRDEDEDQVFVEAGSTNLREKRDRKYCHP